MAFHSLTRYLKPLAAAGVAFCIAAASLAAPTASLAQRSRSQITLTEEDYWSFTSISNAINSLIKEYEQTHPNVTISRTVVPGTLLLSKYLAQSATNSLPSILMPDNLSFA